MRMGWMGLGAAWAAMMFTGCMVGEPEQPTGADAGGAGVPSGNHAGAAQGGFKTGTMVGFDGEEFPILYQEMPDGTLIYEGDIKINRGSDGKLRLGKASGAINPNVAQKWPAGRIPYEIATNLPAGQVTHVNNAISHFNNNSLVKFQPKTAADLNYVRFQVYTQANNICWSNVGMTGGMQAIDLGSQCAQTEIRHEMGHAAGLHHEHTRYDRKVTVQTQNIDPANVQHYNIKPATTALAAGPYDYASLMHYSSNAFCLKNAAGACVGPTMLRTDNNLPIGVNAALSTEDKNSLKALYSDPVTIVQSGNFGASWRINKVFAVGATRYLFLGNPSTGAVNIRAMNANGTPGAVLNTYTWSTGWDVIRFYTLGANTYMFSIKSGVGTMNINRMNANGSVGPLIQAATWSTGWNVFEFYTEGANTYMFSLKSGAGTMNINLMNANGTIGALTQSATWTTGWNIASAIQTSSTEAVLFFMKSGTGLTNVHAMTAGTVGPLLADETWTTGWTTAKYFRTEGKNFFLSYKSVTGGAHVSEVNANGTIGRLRYITRWTTGWNDFSTFNIANPGYFMCTKVDGSWGVDRYSL